MYRLLSLSPSLLLVYLSRRDDHDRCLQLWQAVLSSMAEHTESLHSSVASLLHVSHKGALPNYLKPKTNELDALVGAFLTDVLNGPAKTERMLLLSQILTNPCECPNFCA